MKQYNVYSLNWDYLGCFWTSSNTGPESVGDYQRKVFTGPILTVDGVEHKTIAPMDCYVKLMSETPDKGRDLP